jgi:hypothetical protein
MNADTPILVVDDSQRHLGRRSTEVFCFDSSGTGHQRVERLPLSFWGHLQHGGMGGGPKEM